MPLHFCHYKNTIEWERVSKWSEKQQALSKPTVMKDGRTEERYLDRGRFELKIQTQPKSVFLGQARLENFSQLEQFYYLN